MDRGSVFLGHPDRLYAGKLTWKNYAVKHLIRQPVIKDPPKRAFLLYFTPILYYILPLLSGHYPFSHRWLFNRGQTIDFFFIILTVSDALMEQIAIARNGRRINVVRIPSKRQISKSQNLMIISGHIR